MKHRQGWISDNLYLLALFFRHAKRKVLLETTVKAYQAIIDSFGAVWLLYYLLARVEGGSTYQEILFVLGIFLVLYVVGDILKNWYECSYSPRADVKIRTGLDGMLMDKAKRLPVKYYENPEFYDILQQAKDCGRNTVFLAFSNLTEAIRFLAALVSTVLIVVGIDPWLLLYILFVFPMIFFSRSFGKLAAEKEKALTKPGRMKNCVRNIMLDKGRAMEMRTSNGARIPEKYYHLAEGQCLAVHKRYGARLFVMNFVMTEFYITLIVVSCYLYGILRSVSGQSYMIAEFSVMFVAIMNMVSKVQKILKCYENACKYSVKVSMLKQYLEFEEENKGGLEAEPFESLEFVKVSFSYGDREVLHEVSFRVRKGERCAVVGMNGAGKTTVSKLILRLYDVTEGEILYNGRNIKEYDLQSYRERFAVLFQDFYLFALSLSENILMKSGGEDEEVRRALDKAGLDRENLDCGQVIGREFDENGMVLSGGQQQKLALARIYCRDFDMALLDEPSASMDPVSAKCWFEELMKAAEGKAVLVIGHQLSLLKNMDHILFFDKGRILESGTHEELMKMQGEYGRLYRYQTDMQGGDERHVEQG